MTDKPLIIAYYDGDSEVQILSNFARTPFEMDGVTYQTVEAFWQSLKFDDPAKRVFVQSLTDGFDAKQVGKCIKGVLATRFEYMGNIYKVGSPAHHRLLERALRAKTDQNEEVQKALLATGQRPLRHMLKNRWGTWRPGDSPALPAAMFEYMWTLIRSELQSGLFRPTLPLPAGLTKDDFGIKHTE